MSNTINVVVFCPFCNDVAELEVSFEGFKQWKSGELLQQAMPEINADDRERLISGTCPKCWNSMFDLSDDE